MPPSRSHYLFYALRPPQWIKNLFIFLPLIFGHKLHDLEADLKIFLAFLLFCAASSAVYLLNDLMDFNADRQHPTKRLRPIASRKVSEQAAGKTAIILVVLAIAGSFVLGNAALLFLSIYILLNLAYSRFLKKVVILDVFCLSAFFIIRVLAGTYIAEVALSHWIIIMSGLVALFLGFVKRRQELMLLGKKASFHRDVLHKYNHYYIDQMIGIVTASTVIAYTLYAVDRRTVEILGNYHMLMTVPFVYYGIFRYLYLIHKRKTDGDPTRILLSDLPMKINLAGWILSAIAIIYLKL